MIFLKAKQRLCENIRLRIKLDDKSGIMLIVVLWIMVILSLMAVGLGRMSGIELSLSKYGIGQVRARYKVWSGIVYAMDLMDIDSNDPETGKFDTLHQCGIKLEDGVDIEDVFRKHEMADGYFRIGSVALDVDGKRYVKYGFADEERKININAVVKDNIDIFSNLLVQLGVEAVVAEEIAAALIDWKDEDNKVFNDKGAEDSYYMSREIPFHCKNSLFESVEELLLIKGMSGEIFGALKNYITVFPEEEKFLVNFDTASGEVLRSVSRFCSGQRNNTTPDDADSLVDKILSYRMGDDGLEGTDDDKIVVFNKMGLNSKEKLVSLLMDRMRAGVSKYLRMNVRGVDAASLVSLNVEVVINREDMSIVYWHRK